MCHTMGFLPKGAVGLLVALTFGWSAWAEDGRGVSSSPGSFTAVDLESYGVNPIECPPQGGTEACPSCSASKGHAFLVSRPAGEDPIEAKIDPQSSELKDISAKRIILFIGDGMGTAHIDAARHYVLGGVGELAFEQFPVFGELITHDAHAQITDSAAAATAMATGFKVGQGVISVAKPGDGSDHRTLFECFKAGGLRVGLVTNSFVTDATPAAFAAHTTNRKHRDEIARDYLSVLRPHVLMGGGGLGMDSGRAAAAGYVVAANRDELLTLDAAKTPYLAGLFGEGAMGLGGGVQPSLREMTLQALASLDAEPKGFLLLVENELSDTGSHDNNIGEVVRSIEQFSLAVEAAKAWAAGRDDVLIIVTADHETGGLEVLEGRGPGELPKVHWTHHGHTGINVPLFAWGRYAMSFAGPHDNTEIARLIRDSAKLGRCGR